MKAINNFRIVIEGTKELYGNTEHEIKQQKNKFNSKMYSIWEGYLKRNGCISTSDMWTEHNLNFNATT